MADGAKHFLPDAAGALGQAGENSGLYVGALVALIAASPIIFLRSRQRQALVPFGLLFLLAVPLMAGRAIRERFPDLKVEAVIRQRENVWYAIVDYLKEAEADLAVLGTRGRTGIKILLLGTTAERIIHESPCSVLAVKPDGFEYDVD